MSATAESIITSLGSLPPGEVEHVLKHITAMRSLGAWGGESTDDDSSEARRVFRILCEEMQLAGLIDMHNVSYQRMRNRRGFAEKAKHVCAFLDEQHQDRRVQDGILRIGMQLLIRWMREWADTKGDFLVTPYVLARNIHKLPARLDRAFPGYGAVGMLHLLIPNA
jgi:hypothetical protein